ncbi:MAG: sodium:proton antiporter [Gammaproteobacteria bacterium]|nr:MAG: sodium:proton antiporter [Gammaproteobacteria bacterium]
MLAAGVGALALAAQWLAWRVGLPSILFLIAFGLLAGPVSGWLQPDRVLGELLFPFVSFAVAIILFEGSLTLELREIRGHGEVVRRMVGSGFLVTWLVSALAAHYLAGLAWELAFLFGAIMIVTGPTVIAPLLRAVRPNARIASILRWEGILIDPIGALLAVVVFNVIIASRLAEALGGTLLLAAEMLAVGTLIGLAAGWGWARILRADALPVHLHNMGTLMIVFVSFALANMLVHESGLLAVTIMGIWLANDEELHLDDILNFKESLSLVLISVLFILLAARIQPAQLPYLVSWPALGVLAAVLWIARPLKVWLAARGSELSLQEKLALAWIAPRGIVAAAISALFAFRLEEAGYSEAGLMVPLTFTVIAGTVIWQSISAGPVVRALGVAAPPPHGLLIVGGGPFARALAEELKEAGLTVLLVTSAWDEARAARMAGIPTYFGNPLSDHAERYMDLTGIGQVLAISRRPSLNDLVCRGFAPELGRRNIYVLPPGAAADRRAEDKHSLAAPFRGRRAFAEGLTIARLDSLVREGWELRTTGLSDDFSLEQLLAQQPESILLAAFDEDGVLRLLAADDDWRPDSGWSVITLRPPEPGSQS